MRKPVRGGLTKCMKCGSDDVFYYQKQTRSADEPMTVFYQCQADTLYAPVAAVMARTVGRTTVTWCHAVPTPTKEGLRRDRLSARSNKHSIVDQSSPDIRPRRPSTAARSSRRRTPTCGSRSSRGRLSPILPKIEDRERRAQSTAKECSLQYSTYPVFWCCFFSTDTDERSPRKRGRRLVLPCGSFLRAEIRAGHRNQTDDAIKATRPVLRRTDATGRSTSSHFCQVLGVPSGR